MRINRRLAPLAAPSEQTCRRKEVSQGHQLRDFLEGVYLPDGLLQYRNTGTINAEGVEIEINSHPWDWLD